MYKLLLIMLLNGCVHIRRNDLYLDAFNASRQEYLDLHQCNLPIPVAFKGLSAVEKFQVIDGFNFWSTLAGQTLFVESTAPRLIISNYTEPYYGRTAAWATNYWDENGCIVASKIDFMYPLADLGEWHGSFVAKHELGHVLGLDDSDDRWHIMYRYVDIHTGQAAESEISALKKYYDPKSTRNR